MNAITLRLLKTIINHSTRKNHVLNFERVFAYKSAFSLDKLHPQSSLKFTTPEFVPKNANEEFNGYIPMKELEINYSTSSGPGGQNVNRVNTKVDVRFNVNKASFISSEIKEKLKIKEHNRINKDGFLIVKSELTRSQQLNVADALQKIRQLIRDCIMVPKTPKLDEELLLKQKIKVSQERVFSKRLNSQRRRERSALINNNDLF